MRDLFYGIILIFILIFLYTYDDNRSIYEPHLGDTYIIQSDTLLIVDYSILNNNFILSNGQTVHYKLVNEDHEIRY